MRGTVDIMEKGSLFEAEEGCICFPTLIISAVIFVLGPSCIKPSVSSLVEQSKHRTERLLHNQGDRRCQVTVLEPRKDV